jgi:Amt family ammonium transporter
MTVDDPGGAISAHAMGGLWGIVSVGMFARVPIERSGGAHEAMSAHPGQWVAQLVGIATLIGFVLPLTYCLNWLLDRVYHQRASVEGERQGMDLHDLGAGAYPEFITHSEEFTER